MGSRLFLIRMASVVLLSVSWYRLHWYHSCIGPMNNYCGWCWPHALQSHCSHRSLFCTALLCSASTVPGYWERRTTEAMLIKKSWEPMNLDSGVLLPQCLESYWTHPYCHTHPHDVLVPLFIQLISSLMSHMHVILYSILLSPAVMHV